MGRQIWVVEDEPALRRTLTQLLEEDGHAVRAAPDAETAQAWLAAAAPDLLILDVKLPGMSGFDLLKLVRSTPSRRNLPVIVLTSRAQETQKVLGLELGADDYVTKPFSASELLARIKTVLRRGRLEDEDDEGFLSDGDVTVDAGTRQVMTPRGAVKLRPKEFELLRALMKRKGKVMTRRAIMAAVWGADDERNTRTVDTTVYTLRKALGEAGERVVSVGTLGYKWEPAAK